MELLAAIDIDLILKLVLALIMFGVGLSLEIRDFTYLFSNKKILLVGLALKLGFLPFLGFVVMEILTVEPIFKLGTIILLLCAGATTSNVITYWLKGTGALTIFLTVLSGLAGIIMIPPLTNFFSSIYFESDSRFVLPVEDTVINILTLILLPTIIGLVLNERASILAKKLEAVIRLVSIVLLGGVYLIKFLAPTGSGGIGITTADLIALSPVLLLINIAALITGYVLSRIVAINNRDSMTIGIEMGLQNAALAVLIGTDFLASNNLAKPALIYALFSFWTTALFGLLIKTRYYKENWV